MGKGCALQGPTRDWGAAVGEVVETRSTDPPPYCPRCGMVSRGARRTAA